MAHIDSVRVRWSEVDPYNHLNHALYLTFFEQARIDALASIGFSMGELQALGCQIVVTEVNVKFLKSALGGDDVRIETEMIETRRVSTSWRQRMYRDDELLATIELTAAITDLDGKPRRLPDGFDEALGTIAGAHPSG
ncbi:MAG: acyl-CoA thioesterase [Acidimicrobiia bacterium]|nr:acyl-CoA thioesterase [Acidimicrobiia bacterium]MDH5620212.1 acyl-CoA thioesterase [Gammaproteobacteria bacterium]